MIKAIENNLRQDNSNIVSIESQNVDTKKLAISQYKVLLKAKKLGKTIVHDMWGHNAWDTYDIDEAIEKFKCI